MSTTSPAAATNRARRESTAQATVRALQDLIVDNHLLPGDSLPSEASLLESLGVSRSSLREAVRVLESLDIIHVQHGKGMRVSEMSLSPLINSVLFRTRLTAEDDLSTLRQVVATRKMLDLPLADDLIRALNASHYERLAGHVNAMRESFARGENFAEQDRAFHLDLLESLDNHVLCELVMAMWEIHTIARPLLALPDPTDMQQTVDAHGAILDALQQGDAVAYRAAVVSHYEPLERALKRSAST